MNSLKCDHKTVFDITMSVADKCSQLVEICGKKQEAFNFFDPYFCGIKQNNFLAVPLIFLILAILFKFICTAVEEYLAPCIVYLSEYLKLSDALSGVTLLAFANGAGDVLTALVASDSTEGISYNIGSLYGAGLFVLTYVVAMTIFYSPKKVVVDKSILYRDVLYYIFATLLTLAFAAYKKITWFTSVVMLLIYLLLVITVLIQDRLEQKEKEKQKQETIKEEKDTENSDFLIDKKQPQSDQDKSKLKINIKQKIAQLRNLLVPYIGYMKNKKKIRQEDHENFLIKAIDVIDWPFYWLRKLTIPPNDEHYDHNYLIIWPFLGLFFIALNFIKPSLYYLALIPLALGLSYLFYKYKPESKHDLPSYFIWIDLLGIFLAVLWTKLCCGLLVDLLTFVGVLTKLSSTYLGLTVIAIGNALPDGLTTIAIAKKGQAVMGLTGGIAGQLFGLLIGFGSSMLKKTIKEGEQVFDLFNPDKISENLLDLVVIAVAGLTLIFIFFYGILNNLHFDKKMAVILLIIYIMFLLISTIFAIYQAITGE